MAKSKVKSSRAAPPVTGGNTPMSGKNSAGPQVAGQSASMGRGGGKFAKGGGTKMFGKQSSKPAQKK